MALKLDIYEGVKKNNNVDEKEIDSHWCGICLNTMIDDRFPIIFIPCGHSFCNICSNNSNLKNLCPFCRKNINSKIENFSLKNMINVYFSKNKDNINTSNSQIEENKIIYNTKKKKNDLDTRYSFLKKEIELLLIKKNNLEEKNSKVFENLNKNKNWLKIRKEDLEILKNEIHDLKETINEDTKNNELLIKNKSKLEENLNLLKKSIQAIHEERCKLNLIYNDYC